MRGVDLNINPGRAGPAKGPTSYHMVEAASRLLALPLPTDILVGLRIPLLHVAVQVRRATRGGVVASRLPSTKVETVGGERGELTPARPAPYGRWACVLVTSA